MESKRLKITTNIGELYVTLHAQKRMETRDISVEQLIDLINNPKRKFVQIDHKDIMEFSNGSKEAGCRCVVNIKKMIVVTVTRMNKEYWKSKSKEKTNKIKREIKKVYGSNAQGFRPAHKRRFKK